MKSPCDPGLLLPIPEHERLAIVRRVAEFEFRDRTRWTGEPTELLCIAMTSMAEDFKWDS